ncbi:MAG: phosphatidylserine decarboxylase [Chloroflexota bacterium]
MDDALTFSRWRTVGLMAGLMMGVLLTLMDQTVVSTALPTIVGQLGGLSLYAWVFSAYMLAQTAFLTIFGKLSDLYGRRRLFLLGVGAFMLGSALCGQARTMEQLIFFRGLQGIGGAGLMPTALAILGVHCRPKERVRLHTTTKHSRAAEESQTMRRLPVAGEVLPWLAGLGAVSFFLVLWWPTLGLLPLALLAFVAFFFRDPERQVQAPPGAILSPADGRVVEIGEVYEGRFLDQPARRVSIFLSLLDVHLNRSPIGGRVTYLKYEKGRFWPAFASSAPAENERNFVGIEGDRGKVLVVQIAGVLARRIECRVSEGDVVELGQRIGMIRLGSRTELFLPKVATEVLVQPGDRVKAGETIIGRWTE